MNNKNTFLFVLATISLASISRLIPHLPNFTPLIGMSLFAGSTLKNNKFSLGIVLLSTLISDVLTIHFINYSYTTYSDYFLSISALSIYLCLTLIVLFSKRIQSFKPSLSLAFTGATAGLFFWVMTNLATWASGLWYPTDLAGLGLCLAKAIPFLPNQIFADILFTTLFAFIFQIFHNRYFLKMQKA